MHSSFIKLLQIFKIQFFITLSRCSNGILTHPLTKLISCESGSLSFVSSPIIDTLEALGTPIPVLILTINKTESKELLAFDTGNANLMPYSGTIMQVSCREYLLFNNTRYNDSSKVTAKEYHFPVKISFATTQPGY